MKLNYELTETGIEALRVALFQRHCKDLRLKLKRLAHEPYPPDRLLVDQIKDIERFFLSGWGQLLSGENGEFIIEKVREGVREELARERSLRNG